MGQNRTEYIRERNKDVYKTVKVYIPKDEYPIIIEHMKRKGYDKISGYVKTLIDKDIELSEKSGGGEQ